MKAMILGIFCLLPIAFADSTFTARAFVSHREEASSAMELLEKQAAIRCDYNQVAVLISEIRVKSVDGLGNQSIEADFFCQTKQIGM
jgi:hypothetical protein